MVYRYKLRDGINVDQFLDKFSEYDFGSYCLAVAFTHRDFQDGVIGLAWLGYTTAAKKAGGGCLLVRVRLLNGGLIPLSFSLFPQKIV